jgi:hypothetical protein
MDSPYPSCAAARHAGIHTSPAIESLDEGGEADPTAPAGGPEASEPWSLDDTAPTGDWEEFGRSTNETYK